MLKNFRNILGLSLGASAVMASAYPDKMQLALAIPIRLARDVSAVTLIVSDYKVSLRGKSGIDRELALEACHVRGAHRLKDLCFANGGIYIKLGQHVGQLDHLLPDPYVETMQKYLLDQCPISTLEEVRQIMIKDLGSPPEKLFASFSPNPIASASLAQVHEASTHDGKKVAVKVQHAGIRETSVADIATIEFLVSAVRLIFPDFDYQWLVDEAKLNLPRELDFTLELKNAEKCRSNLSSKVSKLGPGRVHVPHMHPELSSHRVLTMEFIGDAVGVTDQKGLKAAGIRASELAKLISQTFGEMIFIHGHVHCDPHAANMMVRKRPEDGGTQLVLLDHGLYRDLDDEFRLAYAGLWRSLVFADEVGIRRHSEKMNAGDAVPLFAALLTQRPWEDILDNSVNHLAIPNSKEHKEHLARFAADNVKNISKMLLTVPRPLLLLLKTNDCLRSVDKELGQPINTFVITARECTRALALDRTVRAQSVFIRHGSHLGVGNTFGDLLRKGARVMSEILVSPVRIYNLVETIKVEMRICILKAVADYSSLSSLP
ncbi:hypothetical protein CEUSTIGMA_g10938.t1 [Chlamydomonas eustigma]|uniref:ABC1 atypical kinase-like domain-containing protein n=1 Tax=Chlamydomonas eustigma TaxID=1157962 RepID=A0A250XKG3_9CHLO|nr:hypothetical protein CEUSTIGMA_g10938.t1 [Chlamydomonas eustigma]|eukprot:GAX83513.1 hypothetical protein CEUSTIGMA_g10938.t1 [Chlamydomonas eustigma]